MSFLASLAVPSLLSYYAGRALLGFSRLASSGLAALGGFGGMLWFARAQIQGGHAFDRRYRKAADLRGKTVLITGATVGGLGHEAAKMLAAMGATIVVTVRSKEKGEAAVAALGARASFVVLDFLSAASIRAGAAELKAKLQRLDVLVLNAGVGGLAEPADAWMANHVGPFLLTDLLCPLLEATARAHGDVRVVAVSSHAHRDAFIDYARPYDRVKSKPDDEVAYGQSKLAQIMHMRALQRRLRAKPGLDGERAVRCLSVSPGVAFTNIMAFIPAPFRPLCWLLFRSPAVGAQVIKMASIDADVAGGAFLSNCCVERSAGADDCSNKPDECEKLWALSEACAADGRFP